ncbi:MAG: rhodanese-like domain-containing protein [Bacteroidales bacterium]|nr:rhodanese-like domain-containing protein [Bacteroidales bacterium]
MQILGKISILLVGLGFLLVIFPGSGPYSFNVDPTSLTSSVFDDNSFFSADQVAGFVVAEDSTIQLIDLRSKAEFNSFSIPGSLNIPFNEFFESRPETWLYNKSARYVFYSNNDVNSSYALVLARGLGYENSFVMKGGLNEWFEKVMNSKFSGERISPRENALFETRSKAKRFFTEINSLPDSLKLKYAESRRQAERELDGGCE